MAIVLKKLKEKAAANSNVKTASKALGKVASDKVLSDFASQIDLVGTLTKEAEPILAEIKKLQEKLKPLKEAQDALQETLDDLDMGDDETREEYGAAFRLEVKAKGSSRKITDMEKVREFLGDETFFKLASISLKDADAYLTPPQKEEVITTERTKRGYKLVERVS